MNERIRELAEQAHCYACEYAQRPDYNPHNPYNQLIYKKRYDSKFAELIVQECVNVLHDNELWNRHISHALKEHFGVEE